MGAVRPAGAGDLERCEELLAQARLASGEIRGAELAERLGGSPPSVAAWAKGAGRVLFVGEYEGVVMGMAAARLADGGTANGLGVIEFCYVDAGARGVGVGEALVERLLEWFAQRGCTDVDASALPGDRATKQLYERAGFKARLLTLHRPLG